MVRALSKGMLAHSADGHHGRYQTVLELWAQEGSLGRAADRYATLTGDCEFAVQVMLEDQLARPMPGLWLALPVSVTDDPELQRQLVGALAAQRQELQQARCGVFTTIADLYEAAIHRVLAVSESEQTALSDLVIAEACCGDLLLIARLLVEQHAMQEARYHLGADRVPDRALVRALRYAGDAVLFELDPKLQSGIPLQEALAAEIMVESLGPTGSGRARPPVPRPAQPGDAPPSP